MNIYMFSGFPLSSSDIFFLQSAKPRFGLDVARYRSATSPGRGISPWDFTVTATGSPKSDPSIQTGFENVLCEISRKKKSLFFLNKTTAVYLILVLLF